MSEDKLIGIIYSQLIEEFGFGYSEITSKDLWMIAENIAKRIESTTPELNDNQKIVLERLKLVIGSQTSLIKSPSSLYNLLFIPNLSSMSDLDYSIKDLTMLKEAVMSLNFRQEFEVISAFSNWAREQENK
ncbi:TPA: hypothetical protein ACH6JV_001032 [Enterococcus faecium]|uniref:hypothetical protein n=1 Tax=Enterococcus faecium TaxID=1352 RepID=UPI00265EE11A|nr:hypothetical protein [Enterococcus faecium]MDO1600313.1 hypothetical protein [Enterococcus faecium]